MEYNNNFNRENQQDSSELSSKPFFSQEDIKVLLQRLKETPSKIDRNLLLDYIKATAPTTVYRVSKETGFAYTSLKAIFREFEFVGLINSTTKINENNQAYKEYYMEEKKNGIWRFTSYFWRRKDFHNP